MYYADMKRWDVANGRAYGYRSLWADAHTTVKDALIRRRGTSVYGKPFTEQTEDEILRELEKSYYHGFTLLGGEPFEYENQKALAPFLKRVREKFPDLSIWCYSGYVFDKEILAQMFPKWNETREMLDCIDVLVDGRFVEEQKQVDLLFRGSANQRLIDVKKSMETGDVVLWEQPEYIHVEVKRIQMRWDSTGDKREITGE